MSIKQTIEGSLTISIIVIAIAAYIAGIGTYKTIIEIAKLEVISKGELHILKKELEDARSKLTEKEKILRDQLNDVIIGTEEDSNKLYIIATGRAEIITSDRFSKIEAQMMATKKADLDAKIRLIEVIHGIQLTHEFDKNSSRTTSISFGMLTGVIPIERNIIDGKIVEVKLKTYYSKTKNYNLPTKVDVELRKK